MQALKLIAGKTAKARIERDGLGPSMVRAVVGASGGPKWLVLAGLDRFILGKWLPQADQTIDLIGSSIGAWRMAIAAHPDAAMMLDSFLESYLNYNFDKNDSPADTTRKCYVMLDSVLSKKDRDAIVSNPSRNLNIVAVRCRGMAADPSPVKQGLALIAAAASNAISRGTLINRFERVVFHSGEHVALSEQWAGFGRLDVPLQADALTDAVMASGSIPAVVEPITQILGAPPGVYRDGGIIDYHFDCRWQIDNGIILYPHFYTYLIPGWFDKQIKRRAGPEVLDHMLLLAPSDDFIETLPNGVRTDRKDFLKFEDRERQTRWRQVVGESQRLADEFQELLDDHNKLMDRITLAA